MWTGSPWLGGESAKLGQRDHLEVPDVSEVRFVVATDEDGVAMASGGGRYCHVVLRDHPARLYALGEDVRVVFGYPGIEVYERNVQTQLLEAGAAHASLPGRLGQPYAREKLRPDDGGVGPVIGEQAGIGL